MDLQTEAVVHEPMDSFDLVSDEIEQREQTSYVVGAARTALADTDPFDTSALEAIYTELISASRTSEWSYEEPESWHDILDSLPPSKDVDVEIDALDDKILGAWLGRIAGCNLGKPVEWG